MQALTFQKNNQESFLGGAHQCVSFAPALAGHRHGDRAGEVFAWRGAAGPAGHRELGTSQAKVQGIPCKAHLDGRGATSGVHPDLPGDIHVISLVLLSVFISVYISFCISLSLRQLKSGEAPRLDLIANPFLLLFCFPGQPERVHTLCSIGSRWIIFFLLSFSKAALSILDYTNMTPLDEAVYLSLTT